MFNACFNPHLQVALQIVVLFNHNFIRLRSSPSTLTYNQFTPGYFFTNPGLSFG